MPDQPLRERSGTALTESALRTVLAEYLRLLQLHPEPEQLMAAILTEDFATGFEGGFIWEGIDGLRDFLSQRAGFFDERHVVTDVLDLETFGDEARARTRLEFRLRRWEAPARASDEFTGACFHRWTLRRADGRWRVAAQIVERFADLNDNSMRLFATPEEGLNR
jgi:SnoaL-like domain